MQLEHKVPHRGGKRFGGKKKDGFSTRYLYQPTDEKMYERMRQDGVVLSCADCNAAKKDTLDEGRKREWKKYLKEARSLCQNQPDYLPTVSES